MQSGGFGEHDIAGATGKQKGSYFINKVVYL